MSTSMLERFRAPKKLELRDKDAGDTPLRDDKKGKLKNGEIKERERALTVELTGEIAKLQEKLYAARDQKLLLILQGMDTSGKDGTVRSLFAQINPMGLHATGFVAPTDKEKAHDFLWRVHARVPGKGEIGIFNRSHYEDVLVPVVNGQLTEAQTRRRYAQINDFERMLTETGTVVLKFMLHISKDEQRKRLQDRLDDPTKRYKFQRGDLEVRKQWDAYQRAYEFALNATGTAYAPWTVVPADSKTHRNLMIATALRATLQALDLRYPDDDASLASLKIA
jgi:PPK2 family polyphosphate:nucleotide phosphotransferase